MPYEQELLDLISETVAEAMNQEQFNTLAEDIGDILKNSGLSPQDWESALKKAKVVCWMASNPGCIPDTSSMYSSNTDDNIIKEDILQWLEDDPMYTEDDVAWEHIKKVVEGINVHNDAFRSGDYIIEMLDKPCSEILQLNDCWPEDEDGTPAP